MFGEVDWNALFAPNTPLLEIFLRGSIMYLGLFAILRLVLKREAGGIGIPDILVVVLLADASANGLADDYTSVTDGLLLVGTIIFWSHALNWLGFHLPRVQKFFRPRALPIVTNGELRRENMERELLTDEEVMSALRKQGVDDVAEVKVAAMEGDGQISVVPYEEDEQTGAERG